MPYLQNALGFLIETLFGLYLVLVILRFLLQLFRVDFRNPIAQMIVTLTNPPLKFLRRFIPGLYGIDLASVVLMILLGVAKLALLLLIAGYRFQFAGVLVLGLAEVLDMLIWTLLIAVLAAVVLSWVAPRSYHPAVQIVRGLSDPVIAPFRRFLPTPGGLDFSPILTLLLLNLSQQLLVQPLTDIGRSML